MFAPNVVSPGAQPRKRAATTCACSISSFVRRAVAYSLPGLTFAFASRR
jgi:hypothetical protein